MEKTTLSRYKRMLPTYPLGDDEKNPIFTGWAGRPCYPYAMRGSFSKRRIKREYLMLVLENPFLRVEICPDLGGRVFSAFNKKSKKELFFMNPAVKPGYVAINGAWIMSGIEINCPNYGHTTLGLYPVYHFSGENPDGSAWVRTGFHDRISELRWFATFTLRPDSCALDIKYFIHNPSSLPKSCYLWANSAVKAGRNSKLYMPAYFVRDQVFDIYKYPKQGNRRFDSFRAYPVDMDTYGLNVKEETFGYYDPDACAGLIHWAPLKHMKGKKFFTWGAETWGNTWSSILTESNELYYEIQAGMLETQNDFCFIYPNRTITLESRWYPVTELGGLSRACKTAAFFIKGRKLKIQACDKIANARIILKSGHNKLNYSADIESGKTLELNIPGFIKPSEITVAIKQGRRCLAQYRPLKPLAGNQRPKARTARRFHNPKNADQWASSAIEWLRSDQKEKAIECFKNALGLDPKHAEALLGMAGLSLWQAKYNEAMRLALKIPHACKNHPAAQRLIALCLFETGKTGKAEFIFKKVIIKNNKDLTSRIQLARLYMRRRQWKKAHNLLENSSKNINDPVAENLRIHALIKIGKPTSRRYYPEIPHFNVMEEFLHGKISREQVQTLFGDDIQLYIDLANEYSEICEWKPALKALTLWDTGRKPGLNDSLLEYWIIRAWVACKSGNNNEMHNSIKEMKRCSLDYAFAYRSQTLKVLDWAIKKFPQEPRTHYLRGNILAGFLRHKEALEAWQRAGILGLEYHVLERNIGWALAKTNGNLNQSINHYQEAIRMAPAVSLNYMERDNVLLQAGQIDKAAGFFLKLPA
ncbi:MAG: DUF5107 domain-containing protein, partial [bacterium]